MNIDELISELEKAAELATDGEWSVEGACAVDRSTPNITARVQCGYPRDAQAIAIRHNTATQVLSELKTQRARADRLHDLFLRVSEAAGLELFESPTVVLGEVKNLRARTDEARSIINDLAFCIDPNAICDAATELFARAEKYLTEPTPPEATP